MKFETPVIVTGLGRSGTSLVMGLLYEHGVWVDSPGHIRVWNKKGDFVNKGINKAIIKWGINYHNLASEIHKVIISQGYTGGHWGFKNVVKGEWVENFQRVFSPTWIMVRRNVRDVYSSRLRVRAEKGKTDDYPVPERYEPFTKFIRRWSNANKVMDQYRDDHDGFDIWPYKLVQGNYSELEKILNCLSLPFSEKICERFISRENWHGTY